MDERFVLALTGEDRPGIVAAVATALLELGANLEDVATSILRGHFMMMVVFAIDTGGEPGSVQAALGSFADGMGLRVAVWPVTGALPSDRPNHVLAAYGPDRPGILLTVAQVLADLRLNICDMSCRLHEESEAVYVVTMEIHLPEDVPVEQVEQRLAATVGASGLSTSLRPLDQADL
jgi:glycine cleavage system transcriptional repressor